MTIITNLPGQDVSCLLQMLPVVIDHVVFHPEKTDCTEEAVIAGVVPVLSGKVAEKGDMFRTQVAKLPHDRSRILPSIIAFDWPEGVVVAEDVRILLFDKCVSSFEIDLLPVTEMRQDFDNAPAAVAARTESIFIRNVASKNHSLQFVWIAFQFLDQVFS